MISLKVLALSALLVATCECERDNEGRHGDSIKMLMECNDQHGYTKEKQQNLKKQHPDGLYRPNDVPKEYLCSMKCFDERLGFLKDGKYDVENIRKRQFIIGSLKTPEKYLECLKNIDGLKECEDYKKKVKCDSEVGDTHRRTCALKFNRELGQNNIFLGRFGEERQGKDKNHKCFMKCIAESKGVISKDGKIVLEKAQQDWHIMWRVKNKDKMLDCLKKLEIKECEDMSKIFACKKE